MTSLRAAAIRLAHENPDLRKDLLPLLRKTAAMSEAEFWKLTEPYGWGKKTTDFKSIKKDLMKKLSPEEAESVRKTFSSLQDRLWEPLLDIFNSQDEVWVGDDGLGDLIAHIIGLGKKEYEAVLKNPSRALERARKRQYTESFSYAIPYENDYKSLNLSTYLQWAKRIISEYEQVLDASEDDVPWKSKLTAPMKKIVDTMKEFLRTKDVSGLLSAEGEIRKSAEEVEKILSKLNLGMSLPKEGTLEAALKHCANKWFVWNLFSDIRNYLT